MKKEIVVSDAFIADNLTYFSSETCWKCSYKVFYEITKPSVKHRYDMITVLFSEEGALLSVENENQLFLEDIFNQMLSSNRFKKHFEDGKKVIKNIQELRETIPTEFQFFHYNFHEKFGVFRLNESFLEFKFTLEPGKGMKKVSIFYENPSHEFHEVTINQDSHSLLGGKTTNAINEMIKKELKLRFFF